MIPDSVQVSVPTLKLQICLSRWKPIPFWPSGPRFLGSKLVFGTILDREDEQRYRNEHKVLKPERSPKWLSTQDLSLLLYPLDSLTLHSPLPFSAFQRAVKEETHARSYVPLCTYSKTHSDHQQSEEGIECLVSQQLTQVLLLPNGGSET